MNRYLLLIASLMLATVVVVEPVLSKEIKSAPGPTLDESKADKGGKKQTEAKKANTKKKPARNVVKILPLKATKEMAK
jgi:hypothetical protein